MGHYYVKKKFSRFYNDPKIRQMPYNFSFDKKFHLDQRSDSKIKYKLINSWNPFNFV